MTVWTDAAVREALELEGAGVNAAYPTVTTDSRNVEAGALFVALKGERFDGHDYLAEVAGKGARGAIVSHVPEKTPDTLTLYRVGDTTAALGKLGRHRRRKLGVKLVAVTGSNGKTTTKEILRAMLSARYKVHATSGNFNNLIGTPLTLLAAPDDAEILIVELGTSLPGEVAQLGAIVEPDAAVITAISEEHLEGLGDLQGVLEEEAAILSALAPGGLAVAADEPAMLPEYAKSILDPRSSFLIKTAGWAERADNDLRATNVHLDENGDVHFNWNRVDVHV